MGIYSIFGGAVSFLAVWLFARSSWSKLNRNNQAYYLDVLAGYGIINARAARCCIVFAGAVEGLSALALALPATHAFGLMAVSVLLLVYLGIVVMQILQGKSGMDCGCAGPSNRTGIGIPLLLRNLVLALLTASAAAFDLPSTAAEWLLASASGLLMLFCALSAEQLMSNQLKLQQLRGAHQLMRGLPISDSGVKR